MLFKFELEGGNFSKAGYASTQGPFSRGFPSVGFPAPFFHFFGDVFPFFHIGKP